MRGCHLLLTAALAVVAAAWTKEDHEIFRLHDEVRRSEGSDATFYSFLNLKPSAGQEDINKAYRKLSRTLHPDKARSNWIANYNNPPSVKTKPGAKPTVHKSKRPSASELKKFNKEASARFERLSLVASILRGPERKRYDHFVKNGFPKWRGTGYYYERYRPGLGSVLLGLFVFLGGCVHYLVLHLSRKSQKAFVERYIRDARRKAWGDEAGIGAIPGLGGIATQLGQNVNVPDGDESMQWNRKQKREMERQKKKEGKNPTKANKARVAPKASEDGSSTPVEAESDVGPVGAKKRTIAENGKVLIVDSLGHVFLEEENEEGETQELLLDPNEILAPTIRDTFLVRFPVFLYNNSVGRVLGTTQNAALADVKAEQESDEAEGSMPLSDASAPIANGETRKRRTKNKS